jgi:hypothetical protein
MYTMAEVAQAGWYYAQQGNRVGPVSREDIERLVREGKVTADTSVWSGEGEWRPAREDQTLGHLFRQPIDVTTPLVGKKTDDRLAWGIAASPLADVVLGWITGGVSSLFVWLACIVLAIKDEKRLKASGHQAASHWWILLVPVYLWKRAVALKQSKKIFWYWVAAFALALVLGAGGHQASLEKAAVPVVTQIIKDGFQQNQAAEFFGGNILAAGADAEKDAPQCKAVKIDKKVSDGFYYATAFLDTGKAIKISIEEQGDKILVKTMLDQ